MNDSEKGRIRKEIAQDVDSQDVTSGASLENSRLMEEIIGQRVIEASDSTGEEKSDSGPGNHRPNPPAPNPLPPIDLQASIPSELPDPQPIEPIDAQELAEVSSSDLAEVPTPMALRPSETSSMLDKAAHMAVKGLLLSLQAMLDSPELAHASQWTTLVDKLLGWQQSTYWQGILADQIRHNPGLLLPPGINSQASLTKLRNYASQASKASKDDKRSSRSKLRRGLGGSEGFPS